MAAMKQIQEIMLVHLFSPGKVRLLVHYFSYVPIYANFSGSAAGWSQELELCLKLFTCSHMSMNTVVWNVMFLNVTT